MKLGLFGAWLHKEIAANPMNQGGALQCVMLTVVWGGLRWLWRKLIGQGLVAVVNFGLTTTLLMCWWQQIRQGEW
jgi:hypothetical protein